MLKEKIGFIGMGQCGGNIVSNFEVNDYECLFVNTSDKDLATVSARYKIHIPNANGCSKHRDRAILLAEKHHQLILSEVADKLSGQDFIYLVTSTGGGSGSGMTPILLETLSATMPQKSFGCIAVLPSKKETVQTQVNTIMFFKQLLEIPSLKSAIVLDNDRGNKLMINNIFFQLFDDMLKIPNSISELGNLDESEIMQMLNTKGCLMVTGCTAKKATASNIIRTWEENIYAPIEKDKEIKYLGLSSEEDIDIADLTRFIGTPLDIFQGFNQQRTISILAGLSYPMRRIGEINSIAKGNRDILFKTVQKPSLELDTDWLAKEIGDSLEQPPTTFNFEDIFAKYK